MKEPLFIITNLETGHYYCESKYNFCTNKKYAKTFSPSEADSKLIKLKEFFDCEKELFERTKKEEQIENFDNA